MLQAFDREGSSARGILAAADQPRRGELPPEIGGFPGFGAEASARKRRGSCNLSNIPTRVLFEREIRWASHTEAATVEDVGVDHRRSNATGARGAPAPFGCRSRPPEDGLQRSVGTYGTLRASRGPQLAPRGGRLFARLKHGGGAAVRFQSVDPGSDAWPGKPIAKATPSSRAGTSDEGH